MDKGWIKLYRKSKDNPLMRDYKAWAIFCWILLTVDRKTGMMTLGRKWASLYFHIPETTFYGVIQRLQKRYDVIKITTSKQTIKYTIIEVKNWHLYQETDKPKDNQPTINRQSTDTLQEVENKELRITKDTSPNYLLSIPSNDLAEFTLSFICTDRQVIHKGQELYDYCQSKGRAYKDYKSFLRNALRKDFGDRTPTYQFKPDLQEEMSEIGLEKLRKLKEEKLGRLAN